MPRRSSVRTKRWKPLLPYADQAIASKALRDAATAITRRKAIADVGPNVAQRGLQFSGEEFKTLDMNYTVDVDTTTAVQLLNGCMRGDDFRQRNGREIMMKSIELRYITQACVATGSDQTHRIMLVYDRQTNGTALTAAAVLESANTVAPRSLENRRRFKILYDKIWTINSSPESGSRVQRKFYRRLAHPVTFNSGNTGYVGDIATGSLYLVVLGSNTAGTTAGQCTFYSRIRFQDK